MPQKKVLIITYYWPPSGGGGVQRWLKFVKYLPQFGWEPIVFTPENPEFDLKDPSLSKDVSSVLEVLRFPIWEPFGIYKKLFKKKEKLKQGIVIEKTKMSFLDRLSVWIRANLFIPDPRRFWVNPSVKFLAPYIEQHKIDVVITTGPPHSMHLIGLELKKKCEVKWVADFRDPWSDWDLLEKLGVKGWSLALHRKLEKKVLMDADHVLAASDGILKSLGEKCALNKADVITNGFDEDDLPKLDTSSEQDKFRITHLGLLNELRNPSVLWDILEELCVDIPAFQQDLELVLAGMISESILERIRKSESLAGTLNQLEYISHQEVFRYYQNSSLLLLLLNPQDKDQLIIPGKLFEYFVVRKPVLAIGKRPSQVNDLLIYTQTGELYEPHEKSRIKEMVISQYELFKQGKTSIPTKHTSQFSRKNLTKELSKLLDEIIIYS
ncbi:MAG: glycosyltransferase [Reichenbachiella sp.]|uniref:glycosyltransferase n=1 Tax=Reichenbachiella sp. TaxID=2184521 RepID=UPI00296608A9|nr:glycosyltransferase [Reichenbachiella sp.]MDW3211482.1 glycosyltransferase [Reichenbachiella sp.]